MSEHRIHLRAKERTPRLPRWKLAIAMTVLYSTGFLLAGLAKATFLASSEIETWRLGFLPVVIFVIVAAKWFSPISEYIPWLKPE